MKSEQLDQVVLTIVSQLINTDDTLEIQTESVERGWQLTIKLPEIELEEDKYILNIPEPTDDNMMSGWNGAGWYFADETGYLLGPWDTREIAIAKRTEYCNEFLGSNDG